jgi:hypothetical protein
MLRTQNIVVPTDLSYRIISRLVVTPEDRVDYFNNADRVIRDFLHALVSFGLFEASGHTICDPLPGHPT